MNTIKELKLSAPRGPIKPKYELFRWAGEPGWPRRYQEIWAIGDVGTGKCVIGSTRILLGDGRYVRADELVSGAVPDAASVYGLDGVKPIVGFHDNGEREVYELRTEEGYRLRATGNHPVLTLGPGGPTWVSMEKLRPGMHVAVWLGNMATDGFDPHAYLTGLLIGDAYISKNSIVITSVDEETINFLLSYESPSGVRVVRYNKGDSKRPPAFAAVLPSKRMGAKWGYANAARVLAGELGLDFALSCDKKVPEKIWRGSLAAKRSFLQGLFDTDGTATSRDGGVELGSCSLELLEGVQMLLALFGIPSKISRGSTFKRKDGTTATHYRLAIRGHFRERFRDRIGFRLSRKQKLIGRDYQSGSVGTIPILGELVREHARVAYGGLKGTKYEWLRAYSHQKMNPETARRIVLDITHETGVWTTYGDAALKIAHPNIYWATVASVECVGVERTYDIETTGDHSHITDGLITHNTSALIDSIFLSLYYYPGSRVAVVRSTLVELLGSVVPDMMNRLRPMFESGFLEYIRDLQIIRAANGSEAHLFGLDTADNKLWGQQWFRAFVDQGERIRPQMLDLLHTRTRLQVRHKDSGEIGTTFIKLTANWDRGRDWVYKRVEDGGVPLDKNGDIVEKVVRSVVAGKSIESRILAIHSRTTENEELTEDYYRHLLLAGKIGQRAVRGGYDGEHDELVFHEYSVKNIYDYEPEIEGRPVYVGIDHGVAHPTVAVFFVREGSRVYAVREYVQYNAPDELNASNIAGIIGDLLAAGASSVHAYMDKAAWNRQTVSAELDSPASVYASVFAREGIPVYLNPANRVGRSASGTRIPLSDVEYGISVMKGLLLNRRLFVNPKLTPRLDDMLTEFTREDLERRPAPKIDIFDAARYALINIGNYYDGDVEGEGITALPVIDYRRRVHAG